MIAMESLVNAKFTPYPCSLQADFLFQDRSIRAEIDPLIDINWLGIQSRVKAMVRVRHKIAADGSETFRDLTILEAVSH
jgi:hypothetical protein